MQQTTFPMEIVIGEDFSTDETREIVMEYQEKYPGRIRVILSSENLGKYTGNGRLNFFRNLRACSGDYVAILEGDDYWTDASKLQKQADFLEANPGYALAFHDMRVAFSSGGVVYESTYFTEEDDGSPRHAVTLWARPPEQAGLAELARQCFIRTGSALFRNNITSDELALLLQTSVGDWPLFMLLARKGDLRFMADVMGVYSVHDGGVWSCLADARKRAALLNTYAALLTSDFFPEEVTDILFSRFLDCYEGFDQVASDSPDYENARKGLAEDLQRAAARVNGERLLSLLQRTYRLRRAAIDTEEFREQVESLGGSYVLLIARLLAVPLALLRKAKHVCRATVRKLFASASD